jgi:hypothetical protein
MKRDCKRVVGNRRSPQAVVPLQIPLQLVIHLLLKLASDLLRPAARSAIPSAASAAKSAASDSNRCSEGFVTERVGALRVRCTQFRPRGLARPIKAIVHSNPGIGDDPSFGLLGRARVGVVDRPLWEYLELIQLPQEVTQVADLDMGRMNRATNGLTGPGRSYLTVESPAGRRARVSDSFRWK